MIRNWCRAGLVLASLCLLLSTIQCGSTSTQPVMISITSPTTVQTVAINGTLPLTAALVNASYSAVTWRVNGFKGGNLAYGYITGTGLSVTYTAPASVPSPSTFSITVTSDQDSSRSASLAVTISGTVGISIATPSNPQSLSVSSNLSFTAAETGTSNTSITWTVNGITNGNATFGTIAGSGLSVTYIAPATVPSPATFKVTATSGADPTKSAFVNVTITPGVGITMTTPIGPQTVSTNSILGFTASVVGTGNTAVTWTVNGIANGNSTYGMITGSGSTVTYTAPATVPSPATFNVTATSVADTSKSVSIAVTIATGVEIAITTPSAATASVPAQGSLALTAAVTGTTNTAVTWTVNAITNGNATFGTISGTGLSVTFEAPNAIPSPATFNITATSQADPTQSASVSVTITAAVALACGSGNESILSGQYAFQLKGFDHNGFRGVVGSITVDGSGHITAGELDMNSTGATAATHSTISASPASSYSVGLDNRGCATIVTASSGTFKTRFDLGVISLNTATEGQIMEFDPANSSAFAATGQIFKQNPADFLVLEGGAYVHLLTGWDAKTGGRIACGGIHTSSGGNISNSEQTCNDVGTMIQTGPIVGSTGTYSGMDANGRFTQATTSSNTVAYFVTQNAATGVPAVLNLTTDTNPVMAGEATFQTMNTYSQSSLVGDYSIYANGVNNSSSGKIFLAFATSDGSSKLTFNSYQENDGGVWAATTAPVYTYSVDYLGGVHLTNSGAKAAGNLYLTGGPLAVYVGADAGGFAGYAAAQTGSGSFANSSILGTFFGGGTEIVNQSATAEADLVMLSGTGAVSETTDDSSTSGQATDQLGTTTISIAPNGTFTSSANPAQIIGIGISPNFFVVASNAGSAYPAILFFTLNAPPI